MISFVDVTKIFNPNRVVFENLNFDIHDGDFVFITGISGSGKTTLLNLLIKADAMSEGDIVFNSQSLNALKKRHIPKHRQQIGVVFQDYKLINEKTVAENIALPLEIAKTPRAEINSRVDELLRLINLEDRAAYFPRQLSGGEAQRVGIARALATAPSVIFADEPTGNLDYRASVGITKLLKKINDWGPTSSISTHDPKLLDVIKGARHLHLQDGQLIECPASSQVLLNEHAARGGRGSASQFEVPAANANPDDDLEVEGDMTVAAPPQRRAPVFEVDGDQCETPRVARPPRRLSQQIAEENLDDDQEEEAIEPRPVAKKSKRLRSTTDFQEEVLA
jgi:cell division transport system ATP-binding protein